MIPSATLYWYPGCSTCKKAKRWLESNEIAFDAVHLVEHTPSAATLRVLWQQSGAPLKRLFNTAGRSYREGGFSAKLPNMSDDEALEALAADGMLIKRPILATATQTCIGFREAEWSQALK